MSEDELREALERYMDIYMSSPEIDRMLASEHVFSKRFEKKMKRLYGASGILARISVLGMLSGKLLSQQAL